MSKKEGMDLVKSSAGRDTEGRLCLVEYVSRHILLNLRFWSVSGSKKIQNGEDG